MFYYEILWIYHNFKSENLCFLNLYRVHAVRILDLSLEVMLVLPNEEQNTFVTLKAIPSCQIRFLFFRNQIHQCF